MIGRNKSIAFEDLERYWGRVDYARSPNVPLRKYDLVICQEPTPGIGLPAYLIARLTGAKLVMEVHADYIRSALSPFQKFVAINLLRRCDLVRAVSGKIARELLDLGIMKVAVIPSIYIKTDLFHQTKPHSKRDPIVLSVGRLVEQKDFPLLLKSFRIVKEAIPEAKLIIVGRGPLEGEILSLAKRLGIEDGFKLIKHWLSDEDLVKLYNEAASLVITSRYEGGPRVAFEAGACHTPFTSTRVGILAEVAEDEVHGFFAEKPPEIAKRTIELLQDPNLRERMGSNFRNIITTLFEWNKAVRNYAESYLRLMRDLR